MKFFLITTLIAVGLIGLLQIYMLIQIIAINRVNFRVLAFFGFISLRDIDTLKRRCKDYISTYLSEQNGGLNELYLEGKVSTILLLKIKYSRN